MSRARRLLFVLTAALGLVVTLGIGYGLWKRSQSRLVELESVDELRELFNRNRGRPRLVLLLSPT